MTMILRTIFSTAIRRTSALVSFLVFLLTFGATHASTLTGRVVDLETGRPLVGVNVRVQGIGQGSSSSDNGAYNIEGLTPGTYVVVFSHVGYQSKRKPVVLPQHGLTLDVRLAPVTLPGQTVTVTATRAVDRESSVAFTNLDRHEIDTRFHAQGIPTILSEMPSATSYSESGNNIGYTYLTLRGFDQRRVSVMVNGIPQNDPEDHNVYWVNFPDLASSLEDVQVQRGAGNAFYGPAAIGGSINLVTDRFAPDPKVTLTTGYGSYDTRKIGFTLNSGLLDNGWALNAHISKTMTDGYRHGAWVDFLSYFTGAAHHTARSTTRIHVYGSLNRDHLNFYGTERFQTVNGNRIDVLADRDLRRQNPIVGNDEIEDFHQPHLEILNEFAIDPNKTLHNSLFYVQGGGFFDFDGTGWADETYFRLTPDNGFTPVGNPGQSLVRAFVNNHQAGWLPRLSIERQNSTTEVGLEARYHQSLHWGSVRFAENLPAEITPEYRFYEYKGEKWIGGAYVGHNQSISDRVNVNGKLHLATKRYRLFDEAFVGTEFTVPLLFLNPSLGLNVNLTDRTHGYVSFARTTREPRLVNYYDAANSSFFTQPQFTQDANGRFNFDDPLAKPETLNDVEVGTGYTTSSFRATLNLFWMDFRDEIVSNGQLDQFGQPVTGNAKKTLHKGVELTASARVLRDVTLQGNLSLSRNTFSEHTLFDFSGQPTRLDGNRISGFPDALANVRATFERQGFRASLALQHVGKQYTDNSEDNRQDATARSDPDYVPLSLDAYTIANLGLAYDFGRHLGLQRVEFRIDINNLFDTLYETHGESTAYFPGATRNIFVWTKIDL
jgi:iron complex outermembrane receptor protein